MTSTRFQVFFFFSIYFLKEFSHCRGSIFFSSTHKSSINLNHYRMLLFNSSCLINCQLMDSRQLLLLMTIFINLNWNRYKHNCMRINFIICIMSRVIKNQFRKHKHNGERLVVVSTEIKCMRTYLHFVPIKIQVHEVCLSSYSQCYSFCFIQFCWW